MEHQRNSSAPTDNELCDLVRELLNQRLPELILDPQCTYEVISVTVSNRFSVLHASTHRVVVVAVFANNRAKFIGALPPFDPNSLSGFNSIYLSAYLDGQLTTLFSSEVANEIILELDVSTSCFPQSVVSPVCISREEAIVRGFLFKNTPINDLSEAENIEWVSLYGGNVIGPSFEGIMAVQYALECNRVDSAVDLFSGTGSISRFLLNRGVKSVVLVDNATTFGQCIDGMPGNWTKVNTNAFEFESMSPVDLTIADLFCDDALTGVLRLSERVSCYSKYAIFHLGWKERKGAIRDCYSIVLKYFCAADLLQINDSVYCYAKRSRKI